MSDNAASDTPADNSTTNDDNAPTNGDNAASKPEIDWKSESRKWENRAKENRRAPMSEMSLPRLSATRMPQSKP